MTKAVLSLLVLSIWLLSCKKDETPTVVPPKGLPPVTQEKWPWVRLAQRSSSSGDDFIETSRQVTDLQGNTYLNGVFSGTYSFDTPSGQETSLSRTTFSGNTYYTSKYSSKGELMWVKKSAEDIASYGTVYPVVDKEYTFYDFNTTFRNEKDVVDVYQTSSSGVLSTVSHSYVFPGAHYLYSFNVERGVNYLAARSEIYASTPLKVYDSNLSFKQDIFLSDAPSENYLSLVRAESDNKGNIFLIASEVWASSPGSKLYITKFNSNWVKQWATIIYVDGISGGGDFVGHKSISLATDESDNSYLSYRDAAGEKVNIEKYSPKGTLLWQEKISNSLFQNITMGEKGNLIVAAQLRGEKSQIGSFTLTNSLPTARREADIIVVEYDATGKALWTEQLKGRFYQPDVSYAAGFCYVTAQYEGNAGQTSIGKYILKKPGLVLACLKVGE